MADMHPDRAGREPRFVDAHVHITHPDALRDLAAAGIAAARDAGSKQGTGLSPLPASNGTIPVIVSAGRALSRRGGYGAFLGTAVETREEISAEILRLRDEGADILKVIASGVVSLDQPRTVTPGGFSADDIHYIVEKAAQHGLAVMAHANGEAAIRGAAEAGVRSIEHGFFMTDALLELLLKRRVFWVPTAGALRRAAERAGNPAFIEEELERHLVMLEKAFRAGVYLAVGTDCVLPDRRYRSSYEEELALFRKAGIPADVVERLAVEGGRMLLGI